jgi:hypothetical protein
VNTPEALVHAPELDDGSWLRGAQWFDHCL